MIAPGTSGGNAARSAGMRLAARPGAALMVVLWLIVVLGTISSGVLLSTRSATAAAANYRARVVGRFAAESGVTVAVATLQDSLRGLSETMARRDYLNNLDRALGAWAEAELGDARFAIALVDVSARVDVNAAAPAQLVALFSFFTDALEAERAAAAIRAYIDAGESPLAEGSGVQDPTIGLTTARRLRSLDELLAIPGVPVNLVERASPFLTVDGDGTINRVTASDTVRAAAGGELRDEPSRILVVSRGWLHGQPATFEIQAVYAVSGSELVLVRWREREL
ncbi:MAG: type II secretion system protein GspK [Gemmatimonadetes bacterium]|nr:type II secretion system protein GspK [Gemmatimonadota bacterium]